MGGSGSGKAYRGVLSPEMLGFGADGYADEDHRPFRKGSLRDQVLIGLGVKTWGDYRSKIEGKHSTKEQRRIGVSMMMVDKLIDQNEMPFYFSDKTYLPYGYYKNISHDSDCDPDVYGVRQFNVVYCYDDDLWLGFDTRTDSYESPYFVPAHDPELFLAQCRPLKSAEELIEFLLESRETFYGRSLDTFSSAD